MRSSLMMLMSLLSQPSPMVNVIASGRTNARSVV